MQSTGNGLSTDIEIPEPEIPSRVLKFSFEYIECDHEKYTFAMCTEEYWQLFMRELKRYSRWTVNQFAADEHDDARHQIDIAQERVDSAPFEHLIEQFDWADVWQFGIGERRKGQRVMGILVSDTFYIVLLDAAHQVYVKKRGSDRDGNPR